MPGPSSVISSTTNALTSFRLERRGGASNLAGTEERVHAVPEKRGTAGMTFVQFFGFFF